jgi:antitoxin-like ribbon-helix-helix protein
MPERRREDIMSSIKKASLFQSKPKAAEHASDVVAEASNDAAEASTKPARPPSREGKRVLSVYLKPEAWKQLRMLSVNLEVPTQSLGEEAVNLLFEKHRLNRIA